MQSFHQAGSQKGKRGFTLIEVVIGSLFLTVGIVGVMAAFLSGLMLVESSRNMTEASAHARTVLEELRRESTRGLAAVVQRDWTSWTVNEGVPTLPGEQITVTFRNPASDPVEATVTVGWSERRRNRTTSFTSFLTRR